MTKILIFENDHGFAVELRSELTQLGCTVQVFQEGNPGLISAASNPPDLILLSVELPRVNGFSICNKIKKDDRLKVIPLIITSSHSSPETFEQHQRLPTRAEDYVHKPIAFAELLARMQRLVAIGTSASSAERMLVPDENDDYETMQVSASDLSKAMAAKGVKVPGFEQGIVDEPSEPLTRQAVVASPGVFGGGATETAPRPFRPEQTGPPEPFIPEYGLGDDEDDEVERTRVAIDDLERREALMPEAPPGAAAWPSAAVDESRELHQELLSTKRALHAALLQLSQLKRSAGDPEELTRLRADGERLRRELEGARAELASQASSSATSERDALELREQLNQRDREMLSLRDQVSAKERELIEARDGALASEREVAERKKALAQLQTELSAATTRVDALLADKELAVKRAADFKTGAKKIAEQLNQRAKELRELQAQHEEALKQQAESHQLGQKELEDKLRDKLREAEKAHQEQLARLKKEHDEALSKTSAGAADERTALENQADAQLEALQAERDQAAEKASALDQQLAERADELNAAKQALEEEREKLTRAQQEHEKLLADHEKTRQARAEEHNKAVQEAREHEKALKTAVAEGEKERREALKAALADRDKEDGEQLNRIERQHQEELAKLGAQRDEQLAEELDKQRSEHEAALAEVNARVAKLEGSLEAATGESAQTRQELVAKLDALAAESDGLREKLALAEEAAEAEKLSADDDLSAALAERDDLHAQCTALGEHNLQLGDELEAAKAKVAELRQRNKTDRGALARAREALASVVSQLTDAAADEADDDEG